MNCRLPALDPFHPSIMKFVTKTSYPECPGKEHGRLENGKFKFTGDWSAQPTRFPQTDTAAQEC